MEIGRKIYFDKTTGNVLVNTGEMQGSVRETTAEEDFQTFVELAKRVPGTVGCIQLGYGVDANKFATCTGYRVDIEKNKIVFDFTPQQIEEQKKQATLEEQVTQLGKDLAQEKLKNIQKTNTLNQIGQELAKTKMDIIKLQGGK